jgi:hypothetical protein
VRYSERVGFGEFMDAILNIHADANYTTLRYVVHDMLSVTELDFSQLDMVSLVAQELGARYTNPTVRPVVVSTDPRMEEATRTFSAMTKLEVGFFSNMDDALRWVKAPAMA